MKKITLKFLMAIALVFSYSGMAQTLNEAAGWPSADWTISGTYTAAGLLSDPTVDATFGFDDDAAGNGSFDDIQATSPIIDLTAASVAGETWISVSGDIIYYELEDVLTIEVYDADAMTWSVVETFDGNTTTVADFQNCAATVAYTSSVINIAGYTATQLSGFQYRFSYDDLDGYEWGFCLSSPTITSATPPSCADPIALAASPTGIDTADITWSAGNTETDWTYEYGVSPYVQGDGGTTGTVMTTPLLSLSSLTPGETYDIYVQANCGAGGDSSYVTVQWSQPLLGEECSTAISATVETDCSTATPISLDFDNGGSETLTSCDAFGNVGYWVAFTPTATGAVTINVNGSTTLGVAIYDACGGTEILCNNNTLAASTVVVDLTPSTEYLAYFWLDTAAGVIDVCFEEYIVPTAPDCVANPLPVSGEVDIPVGAVTLTWEAPTTGPVPTSYNLYSGTESDGSDLTLEGNYTDLTADLNVAGFDTTIYWQVRPLNGVSIATGCAIWSFTTESAPIGATCETAIDVAALPYTTTDDTASYGDDYSASPGATGCGTTSNYLNGDDVVYAYTAVADGTIKIAMSAIGSTYSGLFVYTDCANIGTECVAGFGNGGSTDDYNLNVAVANGTTYYIVISTWATPQSTTYTLDITEVLCAEPTDLLASTTGLDTVDVTWTAGDSETEWTYEYGVSPYAQGDGGTSGTVITTSSLSLSALTPGETYDIYVQSDCGGTTSSYVTTSWTQPVIGATCETAIDVAALPYSTSDDTANYGDNYSASPGATGCGTTNNYLNGDDVVYVYTATADATINIAMSAIGSTYSGLFVYTDCANIGTECVAGFGNGGSTNDYNLEVSVTNGTTYYIVISTWATPQSTTYTLDITENTCVNAEATYTVVEDCANTQFSVNVDVTSLGTATSVTVSDDQGSADVQVSATGIVSFGPYASGTTVNYTILNDQDASCEIMGSASYSCPPTNDECLNATVLTPGGVFADNPIDGTVAGATADAEAASCGTDGAGVWYSIVVPASGDVTIQVGDDSSGGTGFDSVIEAFTGTCGSFNSIGCDDDGVPGFGDGYSQLELTGLTGGETIYVRVWEYGGDEIEPFSISAYSASLSVGDVENEAAFTYYPNPVKNTLTLNAQNTIEQVTMYNMLGQEVLRVTPNTVDSDINMSSLQTGAYFVKVTIGNVTETIRVIKQ